ncbi:MAG: protein kinase [Planctomycetota bacterium]
MGESVKRKTGTRFGLVSVEGYELLEPIGESPGGVVRKGRHLDDGALVAIKFLDPRLYPSQPDRAALVANLERAARLRHPSLARVLEVGETDGLVFVVSELVQGMSLERMLEVDGSFAESDALAVCSALAEALVLCGSAGLVHGNLTLKDVLVDLDGAPRLTDLGMHVLGGPGERAAEPIQSPHYLAPERVLGMDVDARADLYSLGVCLYRLLTGKFPFTGRTRAELGQQHVNQEVPDPRELVPEISPATVRLLRGLTARDVEYRYLSAAQARADLILVEAGQLPLGPDAKLAPVSGDTATTRPPVGKLPPFLDDDVRLPTGPPPPDLHYTVRLSSRGVTLGVYELDQDVVTIGRSPQSTISIDNPIVSRRHAELRRRRGELFLAALSSTNATALRGKQVSGEHALAPGDVVVLSDKFHLEVDYTPLSEADLRALRSAPATPPAPAPAREPEAVESGEGAIEAPEESPSGESPALPEPPFEQENPYAPEPPPTPPRATLRYPVAAPADLTPGPALGQTWPAPRGFVIFSRSGQEVRSFIAHAFQIGHSYACDLRLPVGTPRKAALIVRGSDGYRLINTSEDPQAVVLNGEPVPDQAVLEPGDGIEVHGAGLLFDLE